MPENLNPEQQLEYLKELRRKYEEVLKDAEKSGDYSEAKRLKQELEKRLTVLETVVGVNEAEPQERKVEKVEKGVIEYEKAKEIMGEDFFGWEAIKKAFKIKVRGTLMIPYSEAQLKQAKAHGEMLVCRVDSLTMEGIVNRVKMSDDEGNLLYINPNWYQDEDFFKKQRPRDHWALVSKKIIKNSTYKDYIEQTKVLRDHLIELDALTENELQEVTDDKLDEIRILMENDLEAASIQLSELKINQNHRRTPVEALYDFVIRFKNTDNKDRMLSTVFDWTNTLSSDFELVSFGETGWDGANLESQRPDEAIHIGVIPVR